MKQEEDKKIATAMDHVDYSRPSELEQVLEEEEEFYVDTQSDEGSVDVQEHVREEAQDSSQVVHIKRSSPISSDVNVNVSVNVKAPSRSLLQSTRPTSSISSSSSVGSIRTAKAEKRMKERLSKEVIWDSTH